mmetsp:Transcript_226/g.940  ORF Transcript_226/g.940 Transcript_226/m.940 type:complete len:332 (+) Transcript_226:1964-2959(+)|eukprot:scaffold395_cov243-Pinguiococcus_pyrenoidosus.AAC.28
MARVLVACWLGKAPAIHAIAIDDGEDVLHPHKRVVPRVCHAEAPDRRLLLNLIHVHVRRVFLLEVEDPYSALLQHGLDVTEMLLPLLLGHGVALEHERNDGNLVGKPLEEELVQVLGPMRRDAVEHGVDPRVADVRGVVEDLALQVHHVALLDVVEHRLEVVLVVQAVPEAFRVRDRDRQDRIVITRPAKDGCGAANLVCRLAVVSMCGALRGVVLIIIIIIMIRASMLHSLLQPLHAVPDVVLPHVPVEGIFGKGGDQALRKGGLAASRRAANHEVEPLQADLGRRQASPPPALEDRGVDAGAHRLGHLRLTFGTAKDGHGTGRGGSLSN